MRLFADLITQLDQTNKTNRKVDALVEYFDQADEIDKLWTIALFSGKRPRRVVSGRQLREWAAGLSELPQWLVDESYSIVGDGSETVALLLPKPETTEERSLEAWMRVVQSLKSQSEEERRETIESAWNSLAPRERFVFNKLMSGNFRVGASQRLMVRALARHTKLPENVIYHRLMGDWTPDSTTYQELLFSENESDNRSRPYPFYLAYPLEADPQTLGQPGDWQVEWKWDGIRSQSIKRGDEWYVWSRGEELISEKFPDLAPIAARIPDGTVLDGELLPWKNGIPLPFALLQTRIGRKNLTKKILQSAPAHIIAYDLLEWEGKDIRPKPLHYRRKLLAQLVTEVDLPELLTLSETIAFESWDALAELREYARDYHSEGFMLKSHDSAYRVGRKRGDWWKWKVDPLTVDGVMIYAQRGTGRRANTFSDFTFAVWQDDETLVPFAKAYSGLTDKEMARLDRWIKKNTVERFGPVRSVKPELVFEIGFEGIQESRRHKSGVALRFPRILRWREDKPTAEADTLENLHALLERYGK